MPRTLVRVGQENGTVPSAPPRKPKSVESDTYPPYSIVQLDLGTVRTNYVVRERGNYLLIASDGLTTGITVRLGSQGAPSYPLSLFNGLQTDKPFSQVFVSNSAQSGKVLTLFIGWKARVQVGVLSAPSLIPAPIVKVATLSSSSTSYSTVVSWTVTTGKSGVLGEVSWVSSLNSKTKLRLTIAGVVQFTDFNPQSALTIPFPANQIASAAVVLLEAKSTDGTSITVDGSITGTET